MNSKHLQAKATRGFDGSSDRVWNVVQFEIEPNLGACGRNRAHNAGAFRGVELQPDFEKGHLVAQLFNEVKRFTLCRHIQRDDDFIFCHCERSQGISHVITRDVSTLLDMTIDMQRMQVLAPAKINLSLKIFGRRNDGFHELDTLIAPISLYDEIRIDKGRSGKGIEFRCDDPSVPQGDDNLGVRAAKAFFETTKIDPAVSIELKKKIPHGAGLGGGSSDAASVLLALNGLFETKLSREALAEMAEPLGSDVPFFLFQSAAMCKGHGEMVMPVKLQRQFSILLLKPAFAISTAWAYSRWQHSREISGIRYAAQEFADQTFVNGLEQPVFEKFVFLAQLKMWLLSQSEVGAALMSGSGSTMFAVMRESADANSVATRAKAALDPELWTCTCETI
jgi:4-diphosphocytidyl-2-C-methyl-D-erythritol kinase